MTVPVPDALNWVSFITGILSFGLTLLNWVALYANFVATISSAPSEIRDNLGNLRQQLCEEREALRHQTREIRSKHTRLRGRISHSVEARRALAYAEETLPLHYVTLRDLWRSFKELERPFLVASGQRAEAIQQGAAWCEADLDEKVHADFERHGEEGSFADWSAVYKCGFAHRFIWWQTKDAVKKLGDEVIRVMLRRTEREVTYTRIMVKEIFLKDVSKLGEAQGPPQGPAGDGGSGGVRGVGAGLRMSSRPGPVKRRTPREGYEEEDSSSGRSSGDEARARRRRAESSRPRDATSALGRRSESYPRSDVATVGVRHDRPYYNYHHHHHHRHLGDERLQQFRPRSERRREIGELVDR